MSNKMKLAESVLGLRSKGWEYDEIGRFLDIEEEEARKIGIDFGAIFVERKPGFECHICGRVCDRRSGLTLHKRAFHKDE